MKRSCRNRFILGAMLSFLILLLLAAAGIGLSAVKRIVELLSRGPSRILETTQRTTGRTAPALP